MDEPRTPERTETFEATLGVADKIGGLINTPRGVVNAIDAPGVMTLLALRNDDPKMSRVAVLLYDPELGAGFVAQLDASTARTTAASLMRLADKLEPKRDH